MVIFTTELRNIRHMSLSLYYSYLVAVDESGEQLAVHALVAVVAEDGLVGAGEIVVRVARSALEVFALVVAGKHRSSG